MTIPTPNEFAVRWVAMAKDKGGSLKDVPDDNIQDMFRLSANAVLALNGDSRAQLHFEAQFRQASFSAQSETYLAGVVWRQALAELFQEIATTMLSAGVKLVCESLASAIKEGLE